MKRRSVTRALVDWITKGVQPPGAYPKLAIGTLVPATSAAINADPRLASTGWRLMNSLLGFDFGSRSFVTRKSGIATNLPAPVGAVITLA